MRRLMIILTTAALVAAGVLMYHHSGPSMHVHGVPAAMYHHGRHVLHLVAMHFHGNPTG